ncbi:MAG: tryptophan--tRNA ligase, partial [Candidatus Krumholzibacteria bacterium]|nr:tryptophan--tRNA ligase [Candidatus Krumholzibacteria bacterium]
QIIKSSGNFIALSFSDKETTESVRNMFTDPRKIRKDDKGHPDGCVVYAFHGIYSRAELSIVHRECEDGRRGCVDCKMELAGRMNEALRPIREKRRDLEGNPKLINEILRSGASKARKVAGETLEEVRDVMNLLSRENL